MVVVVLVMVLRWYWCGSDTAVGICDDGIYVGGICYGRVFVVVVLMVVMCGGGGRRLNSAMVCIIHFLCRNPMVRRARRREEAFLLKKSSIPTATTLFRNRLMISTSAQLPISRSIVSTLTARSYIR